MTASRTLFTLMPVTCTDLVAHQIGRTMTIRYRLPFDTSQQAGFTTPVRLLLATTAAFWMGAAQPLVAPGAVTRSATELRFRDFFRLPVGDEGIKISDTLRQADGQTVRLFGYMVLQQNPEPGRFMLAQRPLHMSEHTDGDADDLTPATVMVYLDPSQQDWAVPYVHGLVAVSGLLSITGHEPLAGRTSWVRLQLDPDATRSMQSF